MQRLRVLSLDGGGVRGVISACVLRRVEELLREESRNFNNSIAENFDLVVGTSTGGLIAGGLLCPSLQSPSKPKYSAEALLELYLDRSDDIFSIPLWHRISSLAGTNDEKYPSDGIEELLEDYFDDVRLSELIKPCLITAFDMKYWRPHFFRQHRAVSDPACDFYLKDVLRATSAAPTYFEPARVKAFDNKVYPLVDGGLVANNPAMVGYAEARNMGASSAVEIVLLSIGTGAYQQSFSFDTIKDWSPLSWIKPTLNITLSDYVVDFQLQQIYTAANVQSLRNYLRIDPVISVEHADMDNAETKNLMKLKEYGEKAAEMYDLELRAMVRLLLESGPQEEPR